LLLFWKGCWEIGLPREQALDHTIEINRSHRSLCDNVETVDKLEGWEEKGERGNEVKSITRGSVMYKGIKLDVFGVGLNAGVNPEWEQSICVLKEKTEKVNIKGLDVSFA
jgi:hypothetical protein